MRLFNRLFSVAAVATGIAAAPAAHATPISYEGMLTAGVTVYGQVAEPDLEGGEWWSFYATAGDQITLTMHRLEANLDPGFVFYAGYGDTDNLAVLAYLDDEIPHLPGYEGPYWDSYLAYTIAETGYYSVHSRSIASADPGQDGVYDYQLTLTGATGAPADVPEPASLGLLGAGLLGLGALRRRKA